jgi:protoporphyrinogen oxidase
MKKKNIVIVGGGIAGLLSALIFSEDKSYDIHVIEKSDKLGGLQKSFDYGKFGKFDYGAHNILETGIEELDALLVGLLPHNEWQVSSAINGQKRALTGLFYNGRLQKNSPFIDIRDIDEEKLRTYIADFFLNLSKTNIDLSADNLSVYEHSKYLFGKKIADDIIAPAFKKLYALDTKELSNMAMYLTPFVRICLFEQEIMDELVKTDKIASRLSFTDQKKLPVQYLPPLKTFYPKKYGIYRVIDAIKERLDQEGVTFHLNCEVKNIIYNQKIEKVVLDELEIENIEYCVFSAGLYPLAKLLDIKVDSLAFDKHPNTVITNILIDKPLSVGDLSYFYCYDDEYKTFRVDNYINYCEGAVRDGLYPVSVEMLLDDDLIDDLEFISKLAISELQSFGVLQDNTKIAFAKTEVLSYGFPLLSQKNINSMNIIREEIENLQIKNLIKIGILSEKNLFFEGEVKQDLYKKIKIRLGQLREELV